MDKESQYYLQCLDCNCNECIHMERDFEKFKKWENYWREYDEKEFNKKKKHAIKVAKEQTDPVAKQTLLTKAEKMRFIFEKNNLTNYGRCKKFCKDISFIPQTFQLNTQHCFEHRRKLQFENI